ncbi:MAG: UDP-N-acetylenolpyruvoylglucosamine reductase [Omnitrophica WOR_2 bacterium RIFCSPHIGHO2_02_FULL_45_21]|nr:MAG: UDP-N-acetylenolpyruvoylglucosamine reductase [Omnitrophica WOR_2 bacterium RIFCSPHIGHO2_02_FULL_45_21]OGX42200.1 MAG: UDP-N-acetylenolpyruvoylglucosamine reductase [Omnitrophica WOR_2 bacterium RIFCSPLOWO2_02_FULL_45_28]
MSWHSGLRAKILFDEPLSKHTTLRVGPKARLWIEPYDVKALRSALRQAQTNKKGYLVIGFGSKLLIKKKKIPLAIHLGSANFKRCVARGTDIIAGAGVALPKLISTAYEHNLGGLEFLAGIPATVGGAVMLNAGVSWPKRIELGSFVSGLEVMDRNGKVISLGRQDLAFGYRSSNLKDYIILGVKFSLGKRKKRVIKSRMQRFRDYRLKTQGSRLHSAGCIFKNPGAESSGRLIDLCGLKGRRIGDALISDKHANFIVNQGKASAADILALMRLTQEEVKKRFKVNLEPEIEVI